MNNFYRNFDVIKTLIYIKFKKLQEYKLNTFISFIPHFAFIGITILSYFILYTNFNNIINWGIKEFMLFLIVFELCIFASIITFRRLKQDLLSGNFNTILTKPTNPFLHQGFQNFEAEGIILVFFYTITLAIYFIYFPVHITKTLIFILMLILGTIFSLNIQIFLNNLAFHMKNNQMIEKIYHKTLAHAFTIYPPHFFQNSIIKNIAYLSSVLYCASTPVQYYYEYITLFETAKIFLIMIIITTIFASTSYFLWKTGIKKYEAYG